MAKAKPKGAERGAKVLTVESEKHEAFYVTLDADTLKQTGWCLGTWLELDYSDGRTIRVTAPRMVELKVDIPQELLEACYAYQREQGYVTVEEAISNLVEQGVAFTLMVRGRKREAARFERRCLVQVHSVPL